MSNVLHLGIWLLWLSFVIQLLPLCYFWCRKCFCLHLSTNLLHKKTPEELIATKSLSLVLSSNSCLTCSRHIWGHIWPDDSALFQMILSSFLDNNNAVQQQHQHSFLVYTFCCDLILIVLDLLHNHSSTLDTSVVCGVPIIAATCSAFPIENDENHLFNVLLSTTQQCRSAFIRWSVCCSVWLRLEFPFFLGCLLSNVIEWFPYLMFSNLID